MTLAMRFYWGEIRLVQFERSYDRTMLITLYFINCDQSKACDQLEPMSQLVANL